MAATFWAGPNAGRFLLRAHCHRGLPSKTKLTLVDQARRPLPRAVQDAQDSYRVALDPVDHDIGRAPDGQFTGAFDPPRQPAPRQSEQRQDSSQNPLVDEFGCLRIAGFDVVVDGETVRLGGRAPRQSQDLPAASLRRVRARRAANLASTSSCGISGRGSSSASCTLARTHAS